MIKTLDLHCDTASWLLYENYELKKNKGKVDINKLKQSNSMAQIFAHFIDLNCTDDPYEEFLKMYTRLVSEINKNPDEIEVVRNVKELDEVNKNGKIGAILAIEEGGVLQGDIKKLKEVYNLGIRIITLTWNYKNEIGYPNFKFQYKDNGLTEKGREIVYEMESLGIIPDCSHLSDRGFYDLIEICSKPFIASHSNAREVTNHSRNLTDPMIKALANKGGVMGINFCSSFLGSRDKGYIDDMVRHIMHIKNVGGIDVISLGTDFDGIENEVEIGNISQIGKLAEELRKQGFSENDIEKIYSRNAIRVLNETLK